jgi:hypothetical protein
MANKIKENKKIEVLRKRTDVTCGGLKINSETTNAKKFAKIFFDTMQDVIKEYKKIPVEQEPIMQNRFCVEFPEHIGIPSFLVQSINLPKLKFYDRLEYEPISIEFLDVIGANVSRVIYKLFKKELELNEFKINLLDPTGVIIESWKIVVDSIKSFDFGNLSYENYEISKLKIIINPSDCILLD